MRLVDTNVLLYSVSAEASEARKAQTAVALLVAGDLAFSVQSLQEFCAQATRASRPAHQRLTHEEAVVYIEKWLHFPVQPLTVAVLRDALALKGRYSLSYWDAAILAAARTLGCDEVLSEDLAHGQDYDGVRVVNPFR